MRSKLFMLQHKYNIGRFDRSVSILRKVVTTNEFNGESETWEVFKTKWAMDDSLGMGAKGTETVLADKTTAVRRTTLVIRYDDTIDEEMRVVMYDQVYGIISVRQPQGIRKRFIELELEFLEGEEFELADGGGFSSGFSNGFNI
jgi:SPP1 family predicted phage head-tail adaptor